MAIRLVELVKECEGFHKVVKLSSPPMAAPYLCPAGYWTVGYGHLCLPNSPPCTREQAEAWLKEDLVSASNSVCRLVSVPLTANQRDALTSWVFNLGSGRFRGSTLRAKLNRGNYSEVPAEMSKWIYGGGVKLPGLIKRRALEVQLWHQPDS